MILVLIVAMFGLWGWLYGSQLRFDFFGKTLGPAPMEEIVSSDDLQEATLVIVKLEDYDPHSPNKSRLAGMKTGTAAQLRLFGYAGEIIFVDTYGNEI